MMPSSEMAVVAFHGDTLVTFLHEREPHVVMRRVVENLGLQWAGQYSKLRAQTEKFSCVDIYTPDARGRPQVMVCMPVRKLALWLAAINPSKIKSAAKRSKVELYQAESAIALHDYWTKGIALRGDVDGLVTELEPKVMRAVGGMVRGIVEKALFKTVPAAISSELDRIIGMQRHAVAEGITALQVAEIAGYGEGQRPRGLVQFISRNLILFSPRHEIRRVRSGSKTIHFFGESTCRYWLTSGGAQSIARYLSERSGQGALRLVAA